MKNSKFIIILFLFLVCIAACKPDKEGGDNVIPQPYLGGRVVLINSDTPVPNALVRFMKWQESENIFDPMVYVEVARDTSDQNGHFDVPAGTDATMAIAYGPQDVFSHESQESSVESYWTHGGEMKLLLTPPAWVRVSVLDLGPLNPEIDYVLAGSPTEPFPNFTPLTSPRIWKLSGNIDQSIYYKLVYEDMSESNILELPVNAASPFDTTDYILSY